MAGSWKIDLSIFSTTVDQKTFKFHVWLSLAATGGPRDNNSLHQEEWKPPRFLRECRHRDYGGSCIEGGVSNRLVWRPSSSDVWSTRKWKKKHIAVKLQKYITKPPLRFPVQARNKSLSFLPEEFYTRLWLLILRCDTRRWNFKNYTHSLPQIWRVTNIILLGLRTKKYVFPRKQHTST